MSVRLGKKIAYLSAAALLVAACSKDKAEQKPDTTIDQPAVEQQQPTVKQPSLEEQELMTWGEKSQKGLDYYAGADRVFFEYDSAELTAAARSTLAKQKEWMDHYRDVRVAVEGHCDERGTREYNLALGERRANAVKNYLVALGVPASRLSTISYGKERPAVVGNGESSWSQNRRGVLVVQ
ncbi:MAG: peptidoglycan-associated lipoprotein Pal [Alphaproteobacteria bacterium]|nr:MAG: peptidoglycan-associated lipoprotein Pal [Alphaproteobacteria bacterium]